MRDPSAADEPPSKRRRIVAGQLALPGAPTVDDGLVVVAGRWLPGGEWRRPPPLLASVVAALGHLQWCQPRRG